MKKKDIVLIILALYAIVQGLSAQCIERYAVTHAYDVIDERICFEYRRVDWNASKVALFSPIDWTGDLQSTPMLSVVKAIISKDQYFEIKGYYVDYQLAIQGQGDDDTEWIIYKALVDEVLKLSHISSAILISISAKKVKRL